MEVRGKEGGGEKKGGGEERKRGRNGRGDRER